MDPVTAVSAGSAGVKLFKDLFGLAKKIHDHEVLEKIAEVQLAYLALVNRCAELETRCAEQEKEVRSLQEQAASMEGMVRKDEVYWLPTADGKLDGPYCPSCLQGPRRRVVMSCSFDGRWLCPISTCNFKQDTPERIAQLKGDPVVATAPSRVARVLKEI